MEKLQMMQNLKIETNIQAKEFGSVRVKQATRDRILEAVDRLNQKELGRKVTPDDVVSLAVTLLKSEHFEEIQDTTLSHFDRLARNHQTYVKEHGEISKDEYLGKILSGEIKQ
jgi:hypothetical protein